MRKIAFINEKGGTCKTTLAVNVASFLAHKKGMRVLLIDLDTQGHAGKCVGLDVRTLSPNVFHWLSETKSVNFNTTLGLKTFGFIHSDKLGKFS